MEKPKLLTPAGEKGMFVENSNSLPLMVAQACLAPAAELAVATPTAEELAVGWASVHPFL